jgi:hypothetical protein
MQAESVRDSEAVPLAREMVNGLRELVASFEAEEGLGTPEALAMIRDLQHREQDIRQCAPWALRWTDLEGLLERDPAKFHERWEEIKQAAREELRSGHRAAELVEVSGSTPWDRARFLAVRQELIDGWQPRNAAEQHLVDQLTQIQTAYEFWLGKLMPGATREARHEARAREAREQAWRGQGLESAPPAAVCDHSNQVGPTGFEIVEQAAAMVDRFQRMYLRTARVLHNLRKGPQPVFVQNAGQVNVGHKQVNLAHQAIGPKKGPGIRCRT